MPVEAFPPLETADERGLLAVGGDLEPETLLLAYRSGIFPWPVSARSPLLWFSPPQRAVLMLDEFKVPRSTSRALRRCDLRAEYNGDFGSVIQQCAKARKQDRGTWITGEIISAYQKLFDLGYAYSVGVYEGDDLVGGLYGVVIGKMITGESMFYLRPNASKFALVSLVERLNQHGVKWIDCQQDTPLLRSFGARLIERDRFVIMTREACHAEQLHL